MESERNATLIKKLSKTMIYWFRVHSVLKVVHWGVGVIGIAASTLAASSLFDKEFNPYFSCIAAIGFGILGFVDPQKRAAKYLKAFRILKIALEKYEYAYSTTEELIEAHKQAEGYLDDNDIISPNLKTPNSS